MKRKRDSVASSLSLNSPHPPPSTRYLLAYAVLAYGATCLRPSYAMSGTDIVAAVRCPVLT
eukprot:466584-Rhodomonas_salina.2